MVTRTSTVPTFLWPTLRFVGTYKPTTKVTRTSTVPTFLWRYMLPPRAETPQRIRRQERRKARARASE